MHIPNEPSLTHHRTDWIPSFIVSSRNGLLVSRLPSELFPGVSTRKKTLVVGILGGIGSGKSAVSRGLSNHFKTFLIDADRVGHDVLGIPTVQDDIRLAFGDSVFDGAEIGRKSLAGKVFGSELHHKQALIELEKIVHPEIRRQVEKQLADIPDETDVVVLDAAVMLEAGWNDLCDTIVFVDTPFETRLKRVEENRGWTADELRRREASQVSLEDKRAVSELIVDNSGSLENAVQQLAAFIDKQLR
ncbi:MAG: dephospho-CoA kinase [Porticoccaceae bacterium]